MIPAFTYTEICEDLSNKLNMEIPLRMVGILFARPGSNLTREQIIPNLGYFYHRSGKSVDFYCGGYGRYWEGKNEYPDQQVVVNIGEHENWLFSDIWFNRLRKEIEAQCEWKYNGSVDLLLCNAKLNKNKAILDFNCNYLFDVNKMIKANIIISVERLFEDIFRYAENPSVSNPTAGLINQYDFKAINSIIKNVIDALFKGLNLSNLNNKFIKNVSANR